MKTRGLLTPLLLAASGLFLSVTSCKDDVVEEDDIPEVKDEIPAIPAADFSAGAPVVAGCGEFVMTIDAGQMLDAFYMEIPKDVFHDHYTWSVESEGVGDVKEVKKTDDNTDSYNLVWTVTEEELWDNLSTTVEKTGYYTYEENKTRVTFKAAVNQGTVDLSGLLADDIWFDNYTYIVHNIATADFNLNEVLTTTDNELLDLAAANEAYAEYSYDYVFDQNQLVKTVGEVTVSVSEDGKRLLANTEVVAIIETRKEGLGDILSFNKGGELSSSLFEEESFKMRIVLSVKNECDRPLLVNAFNGKNSFLVYFEGDPNNYIVNGSFEEDFYPMRKPGTNIFAKSIAYGEPLRVAGFFSEKTEKYWPKIEDIAVADLPEIPTESGIWYYCNSDTWNYTRIYIDELKETPYGDKVLTFHNTGTTHNSEEARTRSARTPFQHTAIQRVSLDNNKLYQLYFSYLKVDELPGSGTTVHDNHITRFIVGIVSSTDPTTEATFSVDITVPPAGDETWKDFNVTFDLPALKAANPALDFSTSAIIFGIQTKEDPGSAATYSMLPGQISIDNVILREKK